MSSNPTTVEDLVKIIQERGRNGRSITAVAGAPGSGKSTLSEILVERINSIEPDTAAVFPMDGYHYDDVILEDRGWRPRKGASFTFDTAGFGQMLDRLRRNQEAEIAVPVFDRELELSRNSARLIGSQVRHLIVEGNYLLLAEEPWSQLFEYFDTTVFLDVPLAILRERLESRWEDMPAETRFVQIDKNDLPNAQAVVSDSRAAEFVLTDF